jgi:hypothetical protein
MNTYCGHILVENGKINNIDLGGHSLTDGVYSIVKESINKRNLKEKEKLPAYDMPAFVKEVKSLMSGREGKITMNQLAKEMDLYETTLVRRIKENNLITLFKLKKPADAYMDY